VQDPNVAAGSGGVPDTAAAGVTGLLEAFSPMMLLVHRAMGPVVGRASEQEAIRQELATATGGRLAGLAFEGEPGIGKTRLLLAARQMAGDAGFTTIAVTADEELRGPFLLARSIFGSDEARAEAERTGVEAALAACLDAMSGHDDPGLASLAPDARVLRTFDLGAVAFRALLQERPIAVLVDDLQWADDDSLRLLRYLVRSCVTCPIALLFAIRPEEVALVTEAVNLLADMERIGILRRLKVTRLTQAETGELLAQTLGRPVDAGGVAVMHAQAEGVPFIVEEMAIAYRESGMVHEIDGVWHLARNAERLVPAAVRTLISRRAAHLPDETKALLADAAILGRHFSLKDLAEVEVRVHDRHNEHEDLAHALAPAVTAGLLVEHGEASPADYSFQHEHVRDFATGMLSPAERRAVHAAIVQLLLSGEPSPQSLPLLAQHAKAAGDGSVCVRFSIEASQNALAASAPEEVLRVVELGLPSAASSQERLDLLDARDTALDMLRRPSDRLEGLAEMAALAEALGDPHLELDVRLRRAAALRVSEEEDRAADLARSVRELAAERGDGRAELAVCMEFGQALLRAAAGEAYFPGYVDVDLDGAEEAYRCAAGLARDLGDEAALAGALREVAVVLTGRARKWFAEQYEIGAHIAIAQRVAAGETIEDILPELPVASLVVESTTLLQQALEICEQLGDRRGAMSCVIAMAYISWAPDVHLGSSAPRHVEEIRRLTMRVKAFTNESERAAFEAQMLYGVHVFSRAKVIPDLAIARGEDAHAHARELGDRGLEFLAAGGTAMAWLEIGDGDRATRWLDRAATIVTETPTPLRRRRLETWRGLAAVAGGDVASARDHLERAVTLATQRGQPAARCEALAQLATAAARLGDDAGDDQLLDVAERAGREAAQIGETLPGHPLWGAQGLAALATVALHRGRTDEALEHARTAATMFEASKQEDAHLDIVIPVATVLAAAEAPEWPEVRGMLQIMLAMIVQRTMDEDVRVRWLRGPLGRRLTELAGPVEALPMNADGDSATPMEDGDVALLQHLMHGKTNREIADEMGLEEHVVTRRLAELFVKIGASSRAEATAFAFQTRVL
jgi:tetratricopeptide (TPR) repeat protein/DNA-binding CsgD family transcriptional regulator